MRFTAVTKAAKRQGDPVKGVHRAADATAPIVVFDFLQAVDRLRGNVSRELVEDLLRKGALDDLNLAIPWKLFEDLIRSKIQPKLIQTIKRAADAAAGVTSETLKQALGYQPVLTFDARNPRLEKWINANTAELIRETTTESKAAIKLVVQRSLSQEVPPLETFQAIKRSIGLTARAAVAVQNVYGRGINAGLDPSEAGLEANLYAERLLRQRASMIARTETMVAANQGLNEGWQQAADEGLFVQDEAEVEWVTTPDDRLCPTCAAMNGARRPVNGTWLVEIKNSKGMTIGTIRTDNPSDSHPNCRCTSILILK